MAEENNETSSSSSTNKDDKGMPEWLTPILSSLGSMGGSYMLWIKPLQDRMDTLTNQMNDLKNKINQLTKQNDNLQEELDEIKSLSENNLSGNDYLPIKPSKGSIIKKRI
jgi:predicted RNase H-like nuclease (RuvC/YqgF family)